MKDDLLREQQKILPQTPFPDQTPIRVGFGKALVELGRRNGDVVVLTADLSEPTKVHWFAREFPERFFQMGISENDMMGTAAGLAMNGKIAFATTFAAFATSLAHHPIRLSVCYNRANVKIVASHGGVSIGGDGATHQAFEDIALMRVLPGMTVILPCDALEAWKATFAVASYNGPVYMRVGRIPSPVITGNRDRFRIGKANTLREGTDAAIIACGMLCAAALEAAGELEKEGVSVRVVNMHTIKPLDSTAVLSAARECGCLVTVEEHTVIGGLGGAVAEELSRSLPVPLEMVGVRDTFGESGEPQDILEKYGLGLNEIVRAVRSALSRKHAAGRSAAY